MTAAAIVRAAVAAGIRVRLVGGNLVLSAQTTPDAQIVEGIRAAKAELVAYLHGLTLWTEEDWTAVYDERAGIMEFDGGLARAEAEARARDETDQLRSLVQSDDG